MLEYLEGPIAAQGEDYVVIDVGGVGIQVYTTMATREAVNAAPGVIKLHTSLIIRENDVALYGFSREEERQLFRLLISVKGVGPKIAIGILSSTTPERLREVIVGGSAAGFKSVKGIGPKTAERVIVELKDKVRKLDLERSDAPLSTSTEERAYFALTKRLGFGDREARSVLREVLKEDPDVSTEELIRKALALLSK